jgi:hypothetical protein
MQCNTNIHFKHPGFFTNSLISIRLPKLKIHSIQQINFHKHFHLSCRFPWHSYHSQYPVIPLLLTKRLIKANLTLQKIPIKPKRLQRKNKRLRLSIIKLHLITKQFRVTNQPKTLRLIILIKNNPIKIPIRLTLSLMSIKKKIKIFITTIIYVVKLFRSIN